LAACSASPEEQMGEGIKPAKEAFQNESAEPNEQIENVELFVPGGFSIEEDSDETNIVMKDNDESYVLFVNPNEQQDSSYFMIYYKQRKKMSF
ncbi:hypothetical protein JQK62_24105, partial [Leptospira santarosai]|nr:hypothetical protein [Leptospira santarosai]